VGTPDGDGNMDYGLWIMVMWLVILVTRAPVIGYEAEAALVLALHGLGEWDFVRRTDNLVGWGRYLQQERIRGYRYLTARRCAWGACPTAPSS
jgi:hypothetical protein